MGTLLGKTLCNPSVDTKDLGTDVRPILSPNPAKQLVTVQFLDASPFDFSIHAIDGKMLKSGVSEKTIGVSDLPNGFYVLKIQKQGHAFVEKFTVQK